MDNKNFFNKKPFTLVTIIAVSFVLGLFISINQNRKNTEKLRKTREKPQKNQ